MATAKKNTNTPKATGAKRGYKPADRDFLGTIGISSGYKAKSGPRAATVEAMAEVAKAAGKGKGAIVLTVTPEHALIVGLPKSVKVGVPEVEAKRLRTAVKAWCEANGRTFTSLPAGAGYGIHPLA